MQGIATTSRQQNNICCILYESAEKHGRIQLQRNKLTLSIQADITINQHSLFSQTTEKGINLVAGQGHYTSVVQVDYR